MSFPPFPVCVDDTCLRYRCEGYGRKDAPVQRGFPLMGFDEIESLAKPELLETSSHDFVNFTARAAFIRRAPGAWSGPGAVLLDREIGEDRTVGPVVARAGLDKMRQRGAHRAKLGQLGVDLFKVRLGDAPDIGACPPLVLVEREQSATILDGEAQRACPTQETQLVHIALAEPAISVLAALRADEADLLVITDGLCRQAGTVCHIADIHARPPLFTRRWPGVRPPGPQLARDRPRRHPLRAAAAADAGRSRRRRPN